MGGREGERETMRDRSGRACERERTRDRNVINAGPRDRRQTKIINIYRPRFARVCPIETQYSLRRPSLMQTHRVRATIAKFRPYANRANSIMLITLNSPEQLFAFLLFFFLFIKRLPDKPPHNTHTHTRTHRTCISIVGGREYSVLNG